MPKTISFYLLSVILVLMCLETIRITRYNLYENEIREIDDLVVKDVEICLYLNGNLLVKLNTVPCDYDKLIYGFLLSEGLINSISDITNITRTDQQFDIETTKSIKKEYKKQGDTIQAQKIISLMKIFNEKCEVFHKTGGTHAAMLCSFTEKVHAFSEDVSRHNAVDRVLGEAAIKGVHLGRCILFSSGRQPNSMVSKASNCGIPMIVSPAAPLLTGVKKAESENITLVGFVREKRLNIYTGFERVIV